MSKPVRFTQADVKRAVAGYIAAGLPPPSVRIDPNGNIIILPAPVQQAHDNDEWADLG